MLMPKHINKFTFVKLTIIVFIAIFMTACMFRLTRDIKQSEMVKFIESNDIKYEDAYYISMDYYRYIKNIPNLDSGEINLYCQPLQAIYFDSKGKILSFNTNCLFPNIWISNNWNFQGIYDVFPAQYTRMTKIYIDINRDSLIKHLVPIFNVRNQNDTVKYDYYIFVFGGLGLKGKSEALLKTVNVNISLDSNKSKIKKYFVFTDEILKYNIRK